MDVVTLIQKFPNLHLMEGNNLLKGRKEELEHMERILQKTRMKNIVLLGEPGVGKTQLVKSFAYKNSGNYYVVEFNPMEALSNTSLRGQFEEKVVGICRSVEEFNKKHNKLKIVLFIDEIHTIMSAGDSEFGTSENNILKPFIDGGDVIVIGATTIVEYKNSIAKDKALMRRFSPIIIEETDDKDTKKIISAFCKGKYDSKTLEKVISMSHTIPDSFNPDISIEIVDSMMAYEKVKKENAEVEKIVKEILASKNIGREVN